MPTLSPQVVALEKQVRARLATASNVDDAARLVREFLIDINGEVSPAQEADLHEATEVVRQSLAPIEILRANSFFRMREPWYGGPGEADRHWAALRSYLVDSKGWTPETVDERIGPASTEIVSLLENPSRATFAGRGLVIGHVQSGKTANMTAVIAKAIDAGYNLVIILAGITNKLRQQTQGRMEVDLVARHRERWVLLTTNDERGDFRMPANGGFPNPVGGQVQLAVVKKNVAPLRQLQQTIDRTLPAILGRLKVLIIDDEADQASINTASGEFDMTRINESIRQILKKFPANCYVGYTATPFANVLINPYADAGRELDDLYPKDFITALPTPDGYFGTERLFGRDPVDAANPKPDEEGLDVIRIIPDDEVSLLQPKTREDKDSFTPGLPDSLRDAILYFLATCAARRVRGQGGSHMSMLIHTSAFVVMHDRLAELITAWLKVSNGRLTTVGSDLLVRMQELWEAEQASVADDLRHPAITFGAIRAELGVVLEQLEVPVENGTSDDRIDYGDRPRTYIVVGGSILARGLTIEGLTVSYFLRTSNQYDTLLQMGRWFGYRPGYEDLPRIWTTEGLATSFRALADIEREIREEVKQYVERQVTPMDFAVRVRAIPGLAITAASKMRAASRTDISYSGKHVQTIRFDHRNERVVSANWIAASNLVSQAVELGLRKQDSTNTLFEGVPTNLIIQFLRAYVVHESHKELSNQYLLGYIETVASAMEGWNVGVVQPGGEPDSALDLGSIGRVRLSTRTRLPQPVDTADIKALMSRGDVLFDCEGSRIDSLQNWEPLKVARNAIWPKQPLLLLYPIDRNSQPKAGSSTRAALDAVGDLIGLGIVFPGTVIGAGDYYSVELRPASADELDDIEAEVEEQLEAGRAH